MTHQSGLQYAELLKNMVSPIQIEGVLYDATITETASDSERDKLENYLKKQVPLLKTMKNKNNSRKGKEAYDAKHETPQEQEQSIIN